jgi:hypothetical protein
MTWDAVWDVLKWVLAALAAGFIGQFGRVLAMRMIHRRRAARAELEEETAHAPSRQPSDDGEPLPPEVRAQLKIEKKRAKAEVKRVKKAAKDDARESGERADDG